MEMNPPIDECLAPADVRIPEVGEEEGIAKRLKMAAEQANVTQVAIAKELGMRHPSVNAWFRGKTLPDIRRVQALSSMLNVTVEWLITGRGCMNEDVTEDTVMEIGALLRERAATHGPVDKTFGMAAALISALTFDRDWTKPIAPHEFAVINILHKVARIVCGQYDDDHWDDICGYAELGKQLHKQLTESCQGE